MLGMKLIYKDGYGFYPAKVVKLSADKQKVDIVLDDYDGITPRDKKKTITYAAALTAARRRGKKWKEEQLHVAAARRPAGKRASSAKKRNSREVQTSYSTAVAAACMEARLEFFECFTLSLERKLKREFEAFTKRLLSEMREDFMNTVATHDRDVDAAQHSKKTKSGQPRVLYGSAARYRQRRGQQ